MVRKKKKATRNYHIIEDERTKTNWSTRPCEECGSTHQVRGVPVFGLSGESRGQYFLCTKCFGPRIHWVDGQGHHYYSPVDEMTPVYK